MTRKIELLAPAGDMEKLKFAFHYGADAVYLGGESFGLRTASRNFSVEALQEALTYAHDRGRKVYLTLNIIPHNEDLDSLYSYLNQLKGLALDGLILSDPGTLMAAQEVLPEIPVHLSTQANTTNKGSALFWHKQGVRRIVLARELSLAEIREIREKTPDTLELEAFVHGAMCISYSGRCLLSNYMAGRDANQGACAQPCRWKYALVEEKRPGVYMPIEEDARGTYIYNSNDLCMIGHLPELIDAGLGSLKIEGRVKSAYYVATVVRAYRAAIDAYYRDPENYVFNPLWQEEVNKASHREFTTGFYFGKADHHAQTYDHSSYVRDYDIVGIVHSWDEASRTALVEQRNHFRVGDTLELMRPSMQDEQIHVLSIVNLEGTSQDTAPHAQQMVRIPVSNRVEAMDILRKANKSE